MEINLHLDVILDCSVCSVAGIFTKLDAGPSMEELSIADLEDFFGKMTPFIIFSGFCILQRKLFVYCELISFAAMRNVYIPI